MKKLVLYIFSIGALTLFFGMTLSACKKDKVSTDGTHKLSFSLDTLSFDTVFSTVGSSTRIFKIYNPNSKKVNISSITLGGGASSFFRLNVNGKSSILFKDIELRAKDSLWIFAEVTVDPNNASNPLFVKDSLICVTNGNIQQVNLEAFGQDVYFHKPSTGYESFELPCGETWTSDKPHLVFGKAVVDTGCQLRIEQGVKVYFHYDGALQVMKGASLKILGTRSNPVYFEGDRRESWYREVSGQWLGLYLEEESIDHELSFLYLKNAKNGLFCEAEVSSNMVALSIDNCSFMNCSGQGLYFKNTSVLASNLLVGNSVGHEMLIEMGGSYEFIHATFSNYVAEESGVGNSGNSVLVKNWGVKDEATIDADLSKCDFFNCIVYGVGNDELVLSDNGGAVFNYSINSSLLAMQGKSNSSNDINSCVFNEDPMFNEPSKGNFLLTSSSPAINIADLSVVESQVTVLGEDLKGSSRTADSSPDAGVYEFEIE